MVKEVYFFTEMGYTAYSQETAASYGYTNLMFPNENFRSLRRRRNCTACTLRSCSTAPRTALTG